MMKLINVEKLNTIEISFQQNQRKKSGVVSICLKYLISLFETRERESKMIFIKY
jgi:hypothetical protein